MAIKSRCDKSSNTHSHQRGTVSVCVGSLSLPLSPSFSPDWLSAMRFMGRQRVNYTKNMDCIQFKWTILMVACCWSESSNKNIFGVFFCVSSHFRRALRPSTAQCTFASENCVGQKLPFFLSFHQFLTWCLLLFHNNCLYAVVLLRAALFVCAEPIVAYNFLNKMKTNIKWQRKREKRAPCYERYDGCRSVAQHDNFPYYKLFALGLIA